VTTRRSAPQARPAARRRQPDPQALVARAAAGLAALLVTELAIGLWLVLGGVAMPLLFAHVAAAVGVWAAAARLAVLAALPPGKAEA